MTAVLRRPHTVWERPTLAPVAVLVAAIVTALALVSAPASASSAQVPEVYRPPVDAVVLDPFRPPAEPWLAGNRGLEYDTSPGTPVYAIGSGLVVFAGQVAGQLYVTVLHGDGIRSSYSYLGSVGVSLGDRVRGGQMLGATSDVPFHLGARIGPTYIDPASLFGSRVGAASVFLVPTGGGGPQRTAPGGRPPVQSGGGAVEGAGAAATVAAGRLAAAIDELTVVASG